MRRLTVDGPALVITNLRWKLELASDQPSFTSHVVVQPLGLEPCTYLVKSNPVRASIYAFRVSNTWFVMQ